jgi:hypothetical protein
MGRLRIVLVGVIALGLLATVWSRSARTAEREAVPEAISDLILHAKSADDQEKIAQYYEQAAQRMRDRAKQFTNQMECYNKVGSEGQVKGANQPYKQASSFCRLESLEYLKLARDDERLAKIHHDVAKGLRGKGL